MKKKHIPIDRTSPLKATEKRLHWRKFWTFGSLCLIAYGLIIFRLFWQFLAVESMIYVMILFLFFHFFYLEIRKLPIKYLGLFMFAITLLEFLFIGFSSILLAASMVTINFGVVYLGWLLQGWSYDKIKRDTWSYLNTWWYMFTVFITIGYSLFVLWYYAKFPFTCQDLSDASNRVINIFTRPVAAWVQKIKIDTTDLFNTKIKEVVTIGQNISLQTKQSTYSTMIQKFNAYKKNLIDQTLKDNTSVNMGICDYILIQLNTIYENPAFKTSVILLMFLIFYGFIRIVLWVMTGIAFVLFKILILSKAYHIKTVLKEVEDIE
jgi:hypothetical protein